MTRTLVHETWGDHAALFARTQRDAGGVGLVTPQVVEVATPENPLRLEYGGTLEHVSVTFETYGELSAAGDNAILICHALTGSAHAAGVQGHEIKEAQVPGWWDPLIGPGKPIDTSEHFVICTNVLGGCYGTTGPSSLNPETGQPYRLTFPRYTVRDMVAVAAPPHGRARRYLAQGGHRRQHGRDAGLGMGGALPGMRAQHRPPSALGRGIRPGPSASTR